MKKLLLFGLVFILMSSLTYAVYDADLVILYKFDDLEPVTSVVNEVGDNGINKGVDFEQTKIAPYASNDYSARFVQANQDIVWNNDMIADINT